MLALLPWAFASAADSGTSTGQLQTGTKYSPLTQINAANVGDLQQAWEYHTGDMAVTKKSLDAFEDEPSLIDGNLIICSTTRKIIALDPATGAQRWVYDPGTQNVSMKKCRGIASWKDPQAAEGAMCKTRISRSLPARFFRLDYASTSSEPFLMAWPSETLLRKCSHVARSFL